MAKLTYIPIVGKKYPMSFSLMASKKIAEKHGSIEKVMGNMKDDEITAETLDTIIDMLELLISQGCAYKNFFEMDLPTSGEDPVIEGKWTPLPREALEVAVGISDIETISEKIEECIGGGKEREVETIAEDEKNGKARAV